LGGNEPALHKQQDDIYRRKYDNKTHDKHNGNVVEAPADFAAVADDASTKPEQRQLC
jgi:hypothetical protein